MGNRAVILSLLCFGVAGVAQVGASEADVVKDFEGVRAEVAAKLVAPMSCNSYSDFVKSKASASCDFAGLCEFMNENHDRAYLYHSPSGGFVPNYEVFRREEAALKACYVKVLGHAHDPATEKTARATFDKGVLAHRLDILQARANFLASVEARDEGAVRDKIDLASAQLAIEDSESASKSGKPVAKVAPPKTTADFELILVRDEAKAKVHFSKATHAAYIQYLVKDAEPAPRFAAPVAPKWQTLEKDPFVDIAQLYDPEQAGSAAVIAENQKLYQTKVDRAARIFDSTKNSMLAFLERSRTNANTVAIDDMKARVQLVVFRPQPLPVDSTICSGPNAFYSPSSHDFSICPQDLEVPEESLRRTIAHEVGHSIDPCNVASPLVKIEGERKPSAKTDTPAPAPDPATAKFIAFKPKPEGSSKIRLLVDNYETLDQTLHDTYLTFTTDVMAAGVGLPQNPFAGVVGCLASPESVGARMASESQARQSLEEEIRRLRAQGATEENSELLKTMVRSLRDLHAQFQNKGACGYLSGAIGQSQMQESFADWVASKIVEDDIQKADENKRRDMAFDSLTARLASCNSAESLAHMDPAAGDLLKKMGCSRQPPADSTAEIRTSIDAAEKATFDPHPGEADRVERIFLANPTIAKAMGCGVKKGLKACE